ncbi:MAG: Holliday junction branch migration DNA helicase RuvB [Anaerolineae bacterium]
MTVQRKRIVDATRQADDLSEGSLRPRILAEFIGQDRVRENVQIFVEAARARDEALDHVMFYGPPGLGKTTLAHIIANEMGARIRITSGPAVERPGDLAAILTNLSERDVLFIDEVHRLRREIEEVLYAAMEDFALDIIVGKGPSARSIRLSLPPFTIVGATTRPASLSAPLRDRFGAVYRLDYYDLEAMNTIVVRGAEIIGIEVDSDGAAAIARRSRGTPRVALRLLRRVRDYAEVRASGHIDAQVAADALRLLDIDGHGLDELDRRVLGTVVEKFAGGPVGVDTVAAAIGEESQTVEEVVEPYLLQLGFLARTSRGRMATALAYEHLGLPVPLGGKQETLF